MVLEIKTSNTSDVNKYNYEYISSLKENENVFLNILDKSSFEDGFSNKAIEYIEDRLSENIYATNMWIGDLFFRYPMDYNIRDSYFVQYGILRIIAYLIDKGSFNFILKEVLLKMVEIGLYSNISYIQEAAIMLIENWRNKDVIPLLEKSEFSDSQLIYYKDLVLKELRKENNNCIF